MKGNELFLNRKGGRGEKRKMLVFMVKGE